jgi:hypothetical protein
LIEDQRAGRGAIALLPATPFDRERKLDGGQVCAEQVLELVLPVDAIRERLNRDPEFLLAARYWYCDIRFFVGADPYFMRIENGRVQSFQHGTQGFDPYTINIGGPVEVWKQMLVPVPRPFYHDWIAASFHHGFTLGGDLESAYAYYSAIRRINAVMRDCMVAG